MANNKKELCKKLYVIGNGFDLHHGLNTRYYDFATYLKINDRSLHDLLEQYIEYPKDNNDIWARFEENLAKLNIEYIIADNEDLLPDFLSDDYRDRDKYVFPDSMNEVLDALTDKLFELFANFIIDVELPESAKDLKLNIDSNALFLTFNYTNTLEELYKINPERILHIHKDVESCYSDIILGHGVNPNLLKSTEEKLPDTLTEEEMNELVQIQIDRESTPIGEGRIILENYYELTFKNTDQIINENLDFFENLSDVEEILVLGHSLSGIDKPYFEKLFSEVSPKAKWIVSYYNHAEKESHIATLTEIGIRKEMIKMIELESLQVSHKQLKIDFTKSK